MKATTFNQGIFDQGFENFEKLEYFSSFSNKMLMLYMRCHSGYFMVKTVYFIYLLKLSNF